MESEKLEYVAPQVTSFTDEEILEELGEACGIRPPPASGL
jgi:hypothetical protein